MVGPEGYFNTIPTFVRNTDGSVGTTSFSLRQAYAQFTAVNYLYIDSISSCPPNMGIRGFG